LACAAAASGKTAADGEDSDENADRRCSWRELGQHSDLSDWWMSEELDGVRAYWTETIPFAPGQSLHAPHGSSKDCPMCRSTVNSAPT